MTRRAARLAQRALSAVSWPLWKWGQADTEAYRWTLAEWYDTVTLLTEEELNGIHVD